MPGPMFVIHDTNEYMLKDFGDIAKGYMPLPDGNIYGFVSELNALQRDILSVLEVPANLLWLQISFWFKLNGNTLTVTCSMNLDKN